MPQGLFPWYAEVRVSQDREVAAQGQGQTLDCLPGGLPAVLFEVPYPLAREP